MATALDPQGDGSPVHWENPKSGNAGSVVQETQAFPRDGKICRGFTATLKTSSFNKTTGGAACAVAAGDWIISDMKSAN